MVLDPCFSNQHRTFEGRRKTDDVILVWANLIRPRPRTEICTRFEAINRPSQRTALEADPTRAAIDNEKYIIEKISTQNFLQTKPQEITDAHRQVDGK
jgi:hypothetical protein